MALVFDTRMGISCDLDPAKWSASYCEAGIVFLYPKEQPTHNGADHKCWPFLYLRKLGKMNHQMGWPTTNQVGTSSSCSTSKTSGQIFHRENVTIPDPTLVLVALFGFGSHGFHLGRYWVYISYPH